MKITHLIIHELEKEKGITSAKVVLYNDVLDNTDVRIVKLIAELNNRYKYRNENYGIFDKDNPTIFHSSFEKYYKNQNENEFINFTKEAASDLRKRIEDIAPAKGGYLIFARYTLIKDFVAVFIVRNILGLSFKPDSKKLNIDDVEHIDFEHLAMACRISIASFKKKEIRYLSFISKNSDDMSRYFTKWVSSADTETNAEETKKLYDLLQIINLPKDPDTGKKYKREDFLERVYHFVNNTPGKTINLGSLSEKFYGDPKTIIDKVEEEGIIINGEFKAHSAQLKNFIQIQAKADDIELTFPKSLYRSIVRIDPKDKTQIIIKSELLAKEIISSAKN